MCHTVPSANASLVDDRALTPGRALLRRRAPFGEVRLVPTRLITTADGRQIPDPRSTNAWRKLAKQVAREEPICWLRLEGCTTRSTTGDHVIVVTVRPDLALVRTNVRGACSSCNYKRGNLPVDALRLGGTGDPPAALSVFD